MIEFPHRLAQQHGASCRVGFLPGDLDGPRGQLLLPAFQQRVLVAAEVAEVMVKRSFGHAQRVAQAVNCQALLAVFAQQAQSGFDPVVLGASHGVHRILWAFNHGCSVRDIPGSQEHQPCQHQAQRRVQPHVQACVGACLNFGPQPGLEKPACAA